MNTKSRIRVFAAAVVGLATYGATLPSVATAQQRKESGGAPQRQSPPPRQQAPQAHARRDVVRTRNYVRQPGQIPETERRPALPPASSQPRQAPLRISPNRTYATQRTFTKTAAGRHYDNGMTLRKGMVVREAWQHRYFPKGHFHFPWYHPTHAAGTFFSPFGFYFGVAVPWLGADACFYYPPTVTFVDPVTYSGDNFGGYSDANDPNYLNDQSLDQDEPGLSNALNELTETFQNADIDGLVSLVDPSMRIAVYEEGQYKYSMNANDFVDLTRDTIQSVHSVSFTINYLHQRAPAVFAASGQQVYEDANGSSRTVYFSYVLQDVGGSWTLTQVETSPDVNQNP